MEKKPDNVVFNSDTNTYDAFIKPFATSFTAPAIKVSNVVSRKNQQIKKANSQFSTVFNEIKEQYNVLVKQQQYNQIIYNAKFNFQPIVGEIYHLYKRKNQEFFLSILAPEECNFNFVGSFQLNSDQIWMKKQ